MINKLKSITEKKTKLAIGLMSGTSLDGIDAALVEIDDHGVETKVRLIEFSTLNFSDNEKESILRLCNPSTSTVEQICKWNVQLGEKFADAAQLVVKQANRRMADVDFISSHGQTVYHMPNQHATLQIGELAVIAAKTQCVTVGDFRPSDMAVGGQGAPLVPYVDYILFSSQNVGRILLNIGGISNISVIEANAKPSHIIAFDTGPGNMLIDQIVQIGTNQKYMYDPSGSFASKGKADENFLERILLEDEYILAKPPKSTGREKYTVQRAKEIYTEGIQMNLSFEDIVATVTQYTVMSIAKNIQTFIDPFYSISEILVGGGGVHNNFLMNELDAKLTQKVRPMEDVGFSSDAKEAIAFAILGNEFINGNSNNLPSATGARIPVSMGKLALP